MHHLQKQDEIKPDRKKMRQTIEAGWQVMAQTIPDKTPRRMLFAQQIRYISPLLWLIQALLLVGGTIVVTVETWRPIEPGSILYMCGPLLALLTVPEMVKDIACDMSQLERCCKNGSLVFLIRIFVIGCANVLLITVLAGITAGIAGENLLFLAIYGLTPFVVVSLISMIFTRLFRLRSRVGVLGMTALLAMVILLFQPDNAVFNERWIPVWVVVFFLSAAGLLWQIRLLLQNEGWMEYGKERV